MRMPDLSGPSGLPLRVFDMTSSGEGSGSLSMEEAFSRRQEAAMSRLAENFQGLRTDEGILDIQSDAGQSAYSDFLRELDVATTALRTEQASRAYRLAFTVNYRALFSDEGRHYRVDVLDACLENSAMIWVNGDKFDFSQELLHRGEVLQEHWLSLGSLLCRWAPWPVALPAEVVKARSILTALDQAWADFEASYIGELIAIEAKARQLLTETIKHEQRLTELERLNCKKDVRLQDDDDYRQAQRLLIAGLNRMNASANIRRKGRDDLGELILVAASARLAEGCGDGACVLAGNVTRSFRSMRGYLRDVAPCLERVDPHLSNNPELVSRLVDWEESWEIGGRYLQDPALLEAFSDLVAKLQVCQELAPAFQAMCEDCDVELFLVLPRLTWLWFLAEPAPRAPLLKALLPHRFCVKGEDACFDTELQGLLGRFRAVALLAGGTDAAWRRFVQRAVAGAGAAAEDRIGEALQEVAMDVERWSMELQRHCPDVWNQCAAVLLQCLTEAQSTKAIDQSSP